MARLAAAGLLLAAALALAHGAVALDDWAASGLAGNISGPGRRLAQIPGGKGSWSSGHPTPHIYIHTALMRSPDGDGELVAWTPWVKSYSSSVYDWKTKKATQLLGGCGIHQCKNAFCSGHTTTAKNEILVFGGHSKDVQWFRHYSHNTKSLTMKMMPSPRWYPGACTLPNGDVFVVGGVKASGYAGWFAKDKSKNNPTYTIYNAKTKSFGPDGKATQEQLDKAFPIHTYPYCVITPDGNIAMTAGKTLYQYKRNSPTTVVKMYAMQDRPGTTWGYPQTGHGMLLPLEPPYDKALFMAVGGSAKDKADGATPASNTAHIIDLMDGAGAQWRNAGPMPHARVMSDGVLLCDGTVLYLNGCGKGVAGWSGTATLYKFKDGKSYNCKKKCSKCSDWKYEPSLYDPATDAWAPAGSLAPAVRPRGYHSTAILLPSCEVMVSGSDVTDDKTAEFYKPPYLNKGPRPVIVSAPATANPGQVLNVDYSSADPIAKALLLRTGSVTHSQAYDARAVYLTIQSNTGSRLSLAMPPNNNVVPPGMYMLTIISNKGVPSVARMLSVF